MKKIILSALICVAVYYIVLAQYPMVDNKILIYGLLAINVIIGFILLQLKIYRKIGIALLFSFVVVAAYLFIKSRIA